MNTVAYIAVSLDGFIADKDGGVDWLHDIPNPEQSDYGFADFMSGIDAILMGSNTFKVVQSFGMWPYEKPVYVLSNSLTEIPVGYEERIQLVNGDIGTVLERMSKEVGSNIYVDGGKTIQSCLRSKVLSKMVITTIPIILGDGIPLFEKEEQKIVLQHEETEVLGVGLVKTTYTLSM